MDLWFQMKRTSFQAQIKQDIGISTQSEHERHSTHKRRSYSIFTKRKPTTSIYILKLIQSIAIHLMSITSKVITSCLSYHNEQRIWEKHISMAYVTNAVYDTKMQTWYDTLMKMQHAYVHHPSQPKLKKEKQLQALLATSKCSLVQRLG
jgi:hypothetical protein